MKIWMFGIIAMLVVGMLAVSAVVPIETVPATHKLNGVVKFKIWRTGYDINSNPIYAGAIYTRSVSVSTVPQKNYTIWDKLFQMAIINEDSGVFTATLTLKKDGVVLSTAKDTFTASTSGSYLYPTLVVSSSINNTGTYTLEVVLKQYTLLNEKTEDSAVYTITVSNSWVATIGA
jgi:hypothetical protein